MDVRDHQLLEATMRLDFPGYARPRMRSVGPQVQRVTACVVLLGTMLLSTLILGRSPQGHLTR